MGGAVTTTNKVLGSNLGQDFAAATNIKPGGNNGMLNSPTGKTLGYVAAPFTGGASLLAAPVARGAYNDVGGAKNAASNATTAAKVTSDAAAAAEQKLALQPQLTPSDNFLAIKNRTLQNMRLGLQSYVGGSAGAATPSLTAPSLSGKSKLGA